MGMFSTPLRRPSARFGNKGDTVTGIVTELRVAPVPDFDDNGRIVGPKFDIEGNPVNQIDVGIRLDDGNEVILHTRGEVFAAIQSALNAAKKDDLNVGDRLSVTYTGDGEPAAEGLNPPKLYEASVSKG